MKSITEVELINFQCHKHYTCKFDTFTAIVGPSDKGKTAIYRGIKWCLYNEIARIKYIRKGTTQATVTVKFNDGTSITRSKGESGNTYDVIYSDGRTIHMKDIGVGPVEEVIMAHGMRPIDLFSKKEILSMRDQLSQPFFLGESPTNKTVLIGKMAKTEVIDLAIKNVSTEARYKNSKLKEYKAELKKIKSDLKEIPDLDKVEKSINKAKDKLELLQYTEIKINNIKSALDNLNKFSQKRDLLADIISGEKQVNDALKLLDDATQIKDKTIQLIKLLSRLEEYNNKKESLNELINKVSLEDVDCTLSEIDEAIKISNDIVKINDKKSNMDKLYAAKQKLLELPPMDNVEDSISNIEHALEIAKAISEIKPVNEKYMKSIHRKEKGNELINEFNSDYKDITDKYKHGLIESKVCPVCMSQITESHIHNIEDYM